MDAKNKLDDIIVAISTPIGTGGIGIVRLSGMGCITLADTLFQGKTPLSQKASHTISYGKLFCPVQNKIIDEVLISVMKAPNTYTKDDVVEINCHGGSFITKQVLETVLKAGARLAENGEFTKRAFLNGRIDLSQAEGIIDMIHSSTELQSEIALNQMEGSLKKEVRALREELLDVIAMLEMAIDYPEHEEENTENYESLHEKIQVFLQTLAELLKDAKRGKILREGLKTVILGKPNVGKSSLLNWLLDEERAIVTEIAGTTRDTVEEYLNLDGLPLKIIDTAGIRHTEDIVEQIGVQKSKEHASMADCILLMLDASKPLDACDKEILEWLPEKPCLCLLNKSDLPSQISEEELKPYLHSNPILSISTKQNQGLSDLISALKDLFFQGEELEAKHGLLGNIRHEHALYQAREALQRTLSSLDMKMSEDFISMDLQEANRYLAEITGDFYDDEIIHRIFTKFCLGK